MFSQWEEVALWLVRMLGRLGTCPPVLHRHTELAADRVGGEGALWALRPVHSILPSMRRGPSHTTSPEVTTRLSPCQP